MSVIKRQIDKDNTIYQGTTAASGLATTITAIGGETN
jgi:hypothetical protein